MSIPLTLSLCIALQVLRCSSEPQLAMDVAFRGALNNGVLWLTIEQRALSLDNDRLLHFATDGDPMVITIAMVKSHWDFVWIVCSTHKSKSLIMGLI